MLNTCTACCFFLIFCLQFVNIDKNYDFHFNMKSAVDQTLTFQDSCQLVGFVFKPQSHCHVSTPTFRYVLKTQRNGSIRSKPQHNVDQTQPCVAIRVQKRGRLRLYWSAQYKRSRKLKRSINVVKRRKTQKERRDAQKKRSCYVVTRS